MELDNQDEGRQTAGDEEDPAAGPPEVLANGAVSPNQSVQTMNVTLFKKQSGVFVKVATKHPVLDGSSNYAVAFSRPTSTGYKVTATFPGNAQYKKSSKSVTLP